LDEKTWSFLKNFNRGRSLDIETVSCKSVEFSKKFKEGRSPDIETISLQLTISFTLNDLNFGSSPKSSYVILNLYYKVTQISIH
jgi:hypothetical protein